MGALLDTLLNTIPQTTTSTLLDSSSPVRWVPPQILSKVLLSDISLLLSQFFALLPLLDSLSTKLDFTVLLLLLLVCSDLSQLLLPLMDMDQSPITLEVLLKCVDFHPPSEIRLMPLMPL